MKKQSIRNFVNEFNLAVKAGCTRYSGIEFDRLGGKPYVSTVMMKIGSCAYTLSGRREYHHASFVASGWDELEKPSHDVAVLKPRDYTLSLAILLQDRPVTGSKRFRMMIRAAR